MKRTLSALGLFALALTLAGCPPKGETRAVMLVSGDASGKALVAKLLGDKADVNVNDIDDFFVTITEISLDGQGGSEVAFTGSTEVNLLDLTGVSQIITDAQVPPGKYTKIRLSIENPRMYLKDDPETEITDIHLTANGRLFVSQTFEVPEGQTSLILLDFNGLKLVQQGNGGYTLTPQLQVDLSILNADVTATGTIASIDPETSTLVLDLGDSSLSIDFATAQIFLATDVEIPTGTAANLTVGLSVRVDGLLQADGSVVAAVVQILPPAA